MDSTERVFERVMEMAQGLIEAEQREPVAPFRSPEEMARHIDFALGERGMGQEDVLALLERVVMATPRTGSRVFFNQLFAGRDGVASGAEMLTVLLNSSMYTYKVAGPQVMIEAAVARHMAKKVGYPQGEGVFVPGGSMANLAAMIMARNAAEPGAREAGLGGGRLIVYASNDSHYSVIKGAGMVGIGRGNVRAIAVDRRGRMDPGALRDVVLEDRAARATPMMICATAGTTVLGAFDPIEALADVAEEFGVWLHVDGAFGGSAILSGRHRGLLAGSGRSDSFAWDAHKLMGVPLSCSVILCRRAGMLRKHFEEGAGYLFQSAEDLYDHGKISMQCGRRNDALKLWAAWKRHGDEGYGRRIDHLFEMARYAAARVEAHPRMTLRKQPESTNVCFELEGASSEAICEWLRREGIAMVGYADVDGRRVVRLAISNGATTQKDIDGFLEGVERAGEALAGMGK